MTSEAFLPLLFRWMHMLAAVIAIGGTVFIRFVLLPAANEALTDEQHQALRAKLMRRWKVIVMVCITALVVSGVYNIMTISMKQVDHVGIYHPLLTVKLLAALGVFFLASALTGRSAALAGLRKNAPRWMLVAAVLGVAVILISGVLRALRG